ncbi:MAG: hypothetical protein WA790_06480 [Sulfitobacter sp.]
MPDKTPKSTASLTRRALTLDVEKYQSMLDAPDMDEAQKTELLNAMWLLVVSFVDLGFDVRPANSCGQEPSFDLTAPPNGSDVINSNHSPNSADFASAANAPATKQEAS